MSYVKEVIQQQTDSKKVILVCSPNVSFCEELARACDGIFKVLVMTENPYLAEGMDEGGLVYVSKRIAAELEQLGQRWVSMVACERYASFSQFFTKSYSKVVRRLALINGQTSLEPTRLEKVIGAIDAAVPCGLPLRRHHFAHDSRGMLHRIHCPCLVVTTEDASHYQFQEATLMQERIPNSYAHHISMKSRQPEFWPELVSLLTEFEEVPAKRPQKNLFIRNTTSQVASSKEAHERGAET